MRQAPSAARRFSRRMHCPLPSASWRARVVLDSSRTLSERYCKNHKGPHRSIGNAAPDCLWRVSASAHSGERAVWRLREPPSVGDAMPSSCQLAATLRGRGSSRGFDIGVEHTFRGRRRHAAVAAFRHTSPHAWARPSPSGPHEQFVERGFAQKRVVPGRARA